jgi:hypothetical protein
MSEQDGVGVTHQTATRIFRRARIKTQKNHDIMTMASEGKYV